MKWGHRARPGPQVPSIPASGTLPRAPRLLNKWGAQLSRQGSGPPCRGRGASPPPRGCSSSSRGKWALAQGCARGLGERLRASPRPPAKAAFTAAQRPGRPGAAALSHSPSRRAGARRGRRAKRLCLSGPAGSLLAPLILPGSGRAHPSSTILSAPSTHAPPRGARILQPLFSDTSQHIGNGRFGGSFQVR